MGKYYVGVAVKPLKYYKILLLTQYYINNTEQRSGGVSMEKHGIKKGYIISLRSIKNQPKKARIFLFR